ncbi:molybdate ABC transporter substrate-binding protein [Pseudorhodobacter sp. E13]|uniref:molybdate ABC transporter substrate-binding protein n=1 Tax=Pseudorhodobacter sp. E13 TaxID=2487931 RepID=UPI000F8C5306|nr:molybdate ABC transporter substrate-binding protein [Pseudorhodobacter sp. E13]RUS60538.1 molybdate ABC transporter substrate-binding protein [Pseudorhodobacter sp. E13]
MLRLIALLFCCALPAQPTPARAETALVAVAANFAGVAEALAADYSAQSGHALQLTTGATGKLYAQIVAGAPFDLMLSADAATPARLHAEGHGAPQPYAYGVLTFWAPGVAADTDAQALLRGDSLRHIAIANPDLAPYGAAARAALQALGLEAALSGKIVMGQNIGQTFALVQSGAAEAGFIARSALGPEAKGLIWDVPPTLYPAIQQDALLLQHGAANPAAIGFLAYLTTAEARDRIAASGYGVP